MESKDPKERMQESALPTNDSVALFNRLQNLAQKGMDEPISLTPEDIQQISFVLAVYLSERYNKESGN